MDQPRILSTHSTFRGILTLLSNQQEDRGQQCVLVNSGKKYDVDAFLARTDHPAEVIMSTSSAILEEFAGEQFVTVNLSDEARNLEYPPRPKGTFLIYWVTWREK